MKMHVAVIDSKVDMDKVYCPDKISEQINFCAQNASNVNDIYSNNSHGTLVINTIEKYCGDMQYIYHVCNIIYNNGKGNSLSLIAALKYIKKSPTIEAVIMSLAFRQNAYTQKIEKICNELNNKGVMIIAADFNNGDIAYPASFQSVFRVGKGGYYRRMDGDFSHISEGYIIGNVLPEFIPYGKGRYHLFGGTSMATAKVFTQFILYNKNRKLLFCKPGKEILKILEKENIENISLVENYNKNELRRKFTWYKEQNVRICDLSTCMEFDILLLKIAGKMLKLGELNYCDFKTLYDFLNYIDKMV